MDGEEEDGAEDESVVGAMVLFRLRHEILATTVGKAQTPDEERKETEVKTAARF